MNKTFFHLGMDSLMSIQLANQFTAHLGISLPPTLTLEYSTVDALTHYLTVCVKKIIKRLNRVKLKIATLFLGIFMTGFHRTIFNSFIMVGGKLLRINLL
jgi:hypothetical protein